MLLPTVRRSIIRAGQLKRCVADNDQEVRDNVIKVARQQGADDEEIAEILREIGL